MKVTELNNEQREELKQRFLEELWYEKKNETVYGATLGDADELVSDEFLDLYYEDTDFTPDDFFCTSYPDEDNVAEAIVELFTSACEEHDDYLDCTDFIRQVKTLKRIDDNTVDVVTDNGITKRTFRITVDRID